MAKHSGDQYSGSELKKRCQALLRGAFAGPPTPLKDIPKKNGESRRTNKKKNAGAGKPQRHL